MSLPVQCMSFLWSWSSVRSASSPVHQNKYLCCSHEMSELMWVQAGMGGSSGQSCGSRLAPLTALFEQCLPASTALCWGVWARWYCGSSCVRIYGQFWNKNRLKLSQELGWWEALPSPKNICSVVSVLVFAAMGPECGCSAGGCLPGAARRSSPSSGLSSSGPCPPAGLRVYREPWQELPPLGSLPFCLQCLVLASDSLNSLSLLCCWNRHFHTCLQLDPLSCPNSTCVTNELRNQSVLKLIGRRWSGWFF